MKGEIWKMNQPDLFSPPTMRRIELNSMSVKNFKGIVAFTLDALGRNVFVYAENGKGKSSLRDAFLWCLFGKDGQNRTEGKGGFDLETFQPGTNEPIHNIDHVVEVVLNIDGKLTKFRRLYAEKWTKHQGSSEKILSGHTTNYWVDDEPMSQREYQGRIAAVIQEDIFRLLTNPFYFNDDKAFPWDKRRKLLLEMAGGMTDEEVMDSDLELRKLKGILAGKSVDSYRKIVSEKIKLLKKQQEDIPPRIDEQTSNLAGQESVDYFAIEQALAEQKAILNVIEREQATAGNVTTAYRQKQQQAFRLQSDIDVRKDHLKANAGALLKQLTDEQIKLQNEIYRLGFETKLNLQKVSDKAEQVKENEAKLVSLRKAWGEENAKAFAQPDPENFICPNCGQALPEGDKAAKIAEMEENFNTGKRASLDKINADGKVLAGDTKRIQAEIEELSDKLMESEASVVLINESLAELEMQIASEKERPGVLYLDDAKLQDLQARHDALVAELEKPVEDSSAELLAQKRTVNDEIERLNKILNNRDVAAKTRARIDELKAEEKQVAQQITMYEGHKFLLDQFTKRKVSLTEDSIASKFKAVLFQMFEENVGNDGVKDCCNTLILSDNGAWVDFNSNGNKAAKVNGGVDIINGLAAHYGITAPIFIDDREGVNNLIETESQVINLVVSRDKELRVEVV